MIIFISFPTHAEFTHKQRQSVDKLSSYQKITWSKYTVSALRDKLPGTFHGNDVSLLPLRSLYFLPSVNLIEMNEAWKSSNAHWPHAIIIANGVYNLEIIEKLISDSSVFKKIDNNTFISYRPLYVAPTARLVLDTVEFRLSLPDGVFVMTSGDIFIIDSIVTSWDESADHYGFRKKIPDEKLLFYGNQFPRPYLLGLSGSRIDAANSLFRGLGYKGQMGTFGLSMNKRLPKKSPDPILSAALRARKKPTGRLIGNTFEDNFFGYFSNNAENVVIVGNLYHDNVIYNLDPHDYTNNILIARNLSYNAAHAHGIIISREVNNSIIAENISIKNTASGIMLDRSSEHNLIYNNLVMENLGDGISIYESDHNNIVNNIVSRNYNNGIFVRNSCDIKLFSNHLFRNAKFGAEISVVDIDFLETRNFTLDPYHKAARASYLDNIFDSNLGSAISAKNGSAVTLKNNKFVNSGPAYFSSDLEVYNRKILSKSDNEEFVVKGSSPCP